MTPLERRPGVISVHVTPRGHRHPVAECASCSRTRIIKRRGLCRGCEKRHEDDGTIGEYGETAEDRMAAYEELRRSLDIGAAAARAGVSRRTGERYEARRRELSAAA